MKRLLLLALFSTLSFAEENCPVDGLPEVKDIEAIAKKMEWFAAGKDHVAKAPCARQTPFTNDEMKKWIDDQPTVVTRSESINGVYFEDESVENLKTFRLLTDAATIFGPDPARQKIFNSNCKKVECAVKEIFGSDEGQRLLYLHRRFGLNGSHLVRKDTAAFTSGQLDSILLSLSDFPERILPVEENRMVMRAPPGSGQEGVYANASITVFDKWVESDPGTQRAIFTHEMGHRLGGTTHVDGDERWKKKSGWSSETKVIDGNDYTVWSASKKDSFVSNYAKTNPDEDFAESVLAYRYNPQALKESDASKYELIKNTVFDGVEYTSQAACENPTRVSDTVKKKIEKKLKNWTPTEAELEAMGRRCNVTSIEHLAQNTPTEIAGPKSRACREEAIRDQAREMMKAQFKGTEYEGLMDAAFAHAPVPLSPNQLKDIGAKVQKRQRENLRAVLAKGFEDEYICKEGFPRYFSQKVDEKKFGSNPYHVRSNLEAVAIQGCVHKKAGKSPAEVAKALLPEKGQGPHK